MLFLAAATSAYASNCRNQQPNGEACIRAYDPEKSTGVAIRVTQKFTNKCGEKINIVIYANVNNIDILVPAHSSATAQCLSSTGCSRLLYFDEVCLTNVTPPSSNHTANKNDDATVNTPIASARINKSSDIRKGEMAKRYWVNWRASLSKWFDDTGLCTITGEFTFHCKYSEGYEGAFPMFGIDFAYFVNTFVDNMYSCSSPNGFKCQYIKQEILERPNELNNHGDRHLGSGTQIMMFLDDTGVYCNYSYFIYDDLGKAGGDLECKYRSDQ
jgi:hypothetical protein